MSPKTRGRKGKGKASDKLKQQKLKLVKRKERNEDGDSEMAESRLVQGPEQRDPASSSQQSTLFSCSPETETRKKPMIFSPSFIDVSMSTAELTKKLTTLCSELRDMKQQDCAGEYREMIPFCMHLAGEEFRSHPNDDVKLLVACCLADILRVFAPEAPFQEPEDVKALFMFFGSQLSGLGNISSPRYKRYFYLMENLSFVEAFFMCLDLEDEDSQDVFVNLFEVLFTAFSTNYGEKVLHTMSSFLSPILVKSPAISFDLLDVILRNLLDNKNPGFQLAKQLLELTSDHIEACIGDFLAGIIWGNVPEVNTTHCANHLYDLIYQLYQIGPSLVNASLKKLESKLMSPDEDDRVATVNLIGRIYSSANHTESVICSALWNGFCGRFNDISPVVRRLCVQFCLPFILNHPETRDGLVKLLCSRHHDSHETVRLEVVKVISGCAINGAFDFVSKSKDLMECLRERSYDKKINIREESHEGLANIYKKYLDDKIVDGPPDWIHNRILQGYYLEGESDKILVEKLFHRCIVPCDAETTTEKVKQLLFVYSTLNSTGLNVFNSLLKELNKNRKLLAEMKSIVTRKVSDAEKQKLKFRLITYMSKLLPNPSSGREPISKFMMDMEQSKDLRENVERICNPASDCKVVLANMDQVLKRLETGVKTNAYQSSVMTILNRSACVLIDGSAIREIIRLLSSLVKNLASEDSEEDREFPRTKFILSKDVLVKKTCLLLEKLVEHFPGLFNNSKTLDSLVTLVEDDSIGRYSSSTLLSILAKFGLAVGPIMKLLPTAATSLEEFCLHAIDTGSSRQVKMAVRCLGANVSSLKEKEATLASVLRKINDRLEESCVNPSAVVALSEVARVTPKVNPNVLKHVMVQYVIKKILLNPTRTAQDSSKNKDASWVDQDSLPEVTQCMLSGMKAVAHWLIGLPNATDQVKSAFQMLNFFVEFGGNKQEPNQTNPFSRSEMAWISLTAGKSILKMLHYKDIVPAFQAQHFTTVATLMNHAVLDVRACFVSKLHHHLSKNFPSGSLPSEMLGLYVLGGFESDKNLKETIKRSMSKNIQVRRTYITRMQNEAPDRLPSQLPFLMPEYMVAFAIVVLTNNPHFTDPDDVDEINDVKRCFRDLLDAVIIKNDPFTIAFLIKLVQLCKNRRNGIDADDETINRKMYVLCDIVHELLYFKSGTLIENPFETPRLLMHFFCKATQSNWCNDKIYLNYDKLPKSSKRSRARKRLSESGNSSPIPTKKTGQDNERRPKISNDEHMTNCEDEIVKRTKSSKQVKEIRSSTPEGVRRSTRTNPKPDEERGSTDSLEVPSTYVERKAKPDKMKRLKTVTGGKESNEKRKRSSTRELEEDMPRTRETRSTRRKKLRQDEAEDDNSQ